jgi:hypothetical protein
MDLLDL